MMLALAAAEQLHGSPMSSFYCQDCLKQASIAGDVRFCAFCGSGRLMEVFGKDETIPPRPADDQPPTSALPTVIAIVGFTIGYVLNGLVADAPALPPKPRKPRKRKPRKRKASKRT